jgi:hypothetical protein
MCLFVTSVCRWIDHGRGLPRRKPLLCKPRISVFAAKDPGPFVSFFPMYQILDIYGRSTMVYRLPDIILRGLPNWHDIFCWDRYVHTITTALIEVKWITYAFSEFPVRRRISNYAWLTTRYRMVYVAASMLWILYEWQPFRNVLLLSLI